MKADLRVGTVLNTQLTVISNWSYRISATFRLCQHLVKSITSSYIVAAGLLQTTKTEAWHLETCQSTRPSIRPPDHTTIDEWTIWLFC